MSWMSRAFLRGLAAIVPVGLTIYVIYWLVNTSESLLAAVYTSIFPEETYRYGIGLALALVLVFLIGWLLGAIMFRRLYLLAIHLLERIPLIKSIYGMLRDMMGFFTMSESSQFNQVVMVDLGGARLIGFVTCESFEDLPAGIGSPDTVGVYLPMSYQLGGYLAMVPRAAVRPIQMSMEQALRFAVTAGVRTKEE